MTAATGPWDLHRGIRMYAGTPPDVFELFRDAARSALSPTDFEAVALAVGFA